MPEVVGAELQLEAVRGQSARRRHHARVVDQQVEPVVPAAIALGERPDRVEAGQVEILQLQGRTWHGGLDLTPSGLAPRQVAARQHHLRAGAGQRASRREAEPAVRPGDHGDAAALVGNLLRGPLGAQAAEATDSEHAPAPTPAAR
jgi:hypothetical protein